jgi:branched-chain amino acid transport system substrate-binding protein
MERTGVMPNMVQAGTYSAVLQYLKAVEAAGTDATEAVSAKLHEMPVDDVFAQGGTVGANGRLYKDVYLMEVKKPGDSDIPWDYYNVLQTIPGDQAYISPEDSGCPLVNG